MSTNLLEKTKQPGVSNPAPAAPVNQPAVPPVDRPVPPRAIDYGDEDEERGFLRRFAAPLTIAAVMLGVGAWGMSGPSSPDTRPPVRKAAVPINVQLPPPPLPPLPPPPPPPKVEQVKEEVMEEQAPVQDDTPPEPEPDNSPPPMGTNITGDGPADGFGLGKAGAGGGNGTGRRLGGSGSKFGYYAAQVQNSISAAMRRNGTTKSATLSIVARIWADDTGRVTRATLNGSTGDPAVDAALRNEVLTGLQLQGPPPTGMKMPINLRLTARAPR